MRPPTLAALRELCAGPAARGTLTVRLELDAGEVFVAYVRTLNTLELDAFDLAVAAGGSPRAELVGRALYDPVDPPPADRGELIREIGGWPGWITDALFGAALTLNRLVDRAYPSRGAQDAQAEEGPAPPLVYDTAAHAATVSALLDPESPERREATARKVTGIMRTLESLGSFQRVS